MANLFEITYAEKDSSDPHRFTSSAVQQTHGGQPYTPQQISRGEIFFEFASVSPSWWKKFFGSIHELMVCCKATV